MSKDIGALFPGGGRLGVSGRRDGVFNTPAFVFREQRCVCDERVFVVEEHVFAFQEQACVLEEQRCALGEHVFLAREQRCVSEERVFLAGNMSVVVFDEYTLVPWGTTDRISLQPIGG